MYDMKNWPIIISIFVSAGIIYNSQQRPFWDECHPFIDFIPSNSNGLRPDPGGTITITHTPAREDVYLEGTIWPHDHCFDPNVCGDFWMTYEGEYEDCIKTDLTNCTAIGSFKVTVPCMGGNPLCEKTEVEINAPYSICDSCYVVSVTTTNYINPGYEWSTGEMINPIEICEPGIYAVTVMETHPDGTMCMDAASVEIFPGGDEDITAEIICQ